MSKLVNKTSTTFKTKQGWPISLPLAEPKGFKRLRCVRTSTLTREIGRVLSAGHWTICPLTGKMIRIWRHGLHQSQVNTLRRLRDRGDRLRKTYIPLEAFSGHRDGNLAKMVHWGLVLPLTKASAYEGENVNGMWRITKRGRDWLAGKIRIPRQVAILLGQRIGYVDAKDLITVDQVQEVFARDALLAGKDGKAPKSAAKAVA
jgi:hypothetical protein